MQVRTYAGKSGGGALRSGANDGRIMARNEGTGVTSTRTPVVTTVVAGGNRYDPTLSQKIMHARFQTGACVLAYDRPQKVEIVCAFCEKRFLIHQYRLRDGSLNRYCSKSCSAKGRARPPEYRAKVSAALRGEKSSTWKGGHSRQFKRGYRSEQYKHWRAAVFERDAFTCQGCGATGYVTAHHILPFATHPDSRYDVTNGVTLCETCHAKRDKYYARYHPTARGA